MNKSTLESSAMKKPSTGDSVAFSAEQQRCYERACERIDPERLKQLVASLVNIHSPTGAERQISEFMTGHMASMGLNSQYQPMTATAGNVFGRLPGRGDGPSLMLYAPLDTHLEADPERDLPWAGEVLRDDMKPSAQFHDETVVGLGASNPKGMVAALTEAANALIDAGVELDGDLVLAFAGGGMPLIATDRDNAGISNGAAYLLTHGVNTDFGVIMKPWDEVYYEHPGMCWFKVSVEGTMGYAGIPRGTPGFRSSVVPAAKVIEELEAWLPEYTERNSHGQIEPQGWIASVRGGWPERPAFPSAVTEIYLDMRISTKQTPASTHAEFSEKMRDILQRHPEISAKWEMVVSVPASSVDPENWIVRSAVRAWEDTHGRAYGGAPRMSGQTDAAMLAKLGLPLVRVGYPWPSTAPGVPDLGEGLGGMGVCHVPDLLNTIRTVIRIIIDTCMRSRKDVGLN